MEDEYKLGDLSNVAIIKDIKRPTFQGHANIRRWICQ